MPRVVLLRRINDVWGAALSQLLQLLLAETGPDLADGLVRLSVGVIYGQQVGAVHAWCGRFV